MKIVTVNVPISYVEAIEKLVGDNGLYPSRSELIRVAIRSFLLRELNMATNIKRMDPKNRESNEAEDGFVNVPVENKENGTTEFKTYKIIKTLVKDNVEKGMRGDSGYATKSNDRDSIKKKGRSEKRHKNPFWSKREGYYQSKENPNIVFIKGEGKMSKGKAIKNNLIEV
jgi:Arc/MetJ-type ribon-helix-helix transcriptional regulator